MTVALLDACILYPPSLRDLVMRLAAVGAYEPRMTNEIHDEWTRHVLADHPEVTPAQLKRTRGLMNQVAVKGLVSGYERHIPNLSLPDANDRHVLAAAIESGARVIVTFNLSDFPAAVLAAYRIEALHPDHFLLALFENAPELFLYAARVHRASLKKPPKTQTTYIETLRKNRLMELAQQLEEHLADI